MRIEALMEKERRVQYRLLSFLRGSPQAIALKLALLETGLSRATLLKYINNLNSYFEQEKVNCRIVYYKDKLFLEEDYNLSNQEVLKALMKDSIKYTILISLFNQRQFTIVGLSQELMVSEATLNRHLAHLNELLAEFDIAISQGKQIGDELQWRYFYYELFKQLWSYDKCQNMIKKLDLDSLILLIERLAQHTLTREAQQNLGLWFSICHHRLLAMEKISDNLKPIVEHYQCNAFYKRLDAALVLYMSRFALEYREGEVLATFAFLHSQNILPINTMEYIMGFGGPIIDCVTETIIYFKKESILADETSDQVIYQLGQLYSHYYFFKGHILVEQPDLEQTYRLIDHNMRDKLHHISKKIIANVNRIRPLTEDGCSLLTLHLLELLIFSKNSQKMPFRIGLDMTGNAVEQSLLEYRIRQHFSGNNSIQVEPYDEGKGFDMVIYQSRSRPYKAKLTYCLNKGASERELQEIDSLIYDN
ncbi:MULTISPECIES: helix-turn-helix domain-containing protein [Streptococcus]|uniref:Helix-turn-helix domain-containing protein n=5 Tax=Streptococcus agalactiae TaxID=1311 RepID=A0A076YZ43_STRAG|nr:MULTISPECIES: helix-turn-helix domain-containing protein [Streptococcus]EPT71870.1 trans-acting positive regulator [Streptococcus agalactiae CCUG 38383]EPX16969.1 trans-acting positive regulator [Streptococcus agalactiae LDS 610]MEE3843593.1 helix-turn-helix domain-containing protein [Streptococcus sp. R4]AIK70879.1 trans-acting positive regulator [Streptococcus agalactiae]AIK72949.1 trans-acting positive regulator [Streptococcus agalactiae]